MPTKTKTRTWLLTRATGGAGNWCAHPERCEHAVAIAHAVAHGEMLSQVVNSDGIETLRRGGEFIDMQASCMLSEE